MDVTSSVGPVEGLEDAAKRIASKKMRYVGHLKEERRMRIDSECSTDSGFEILENLEPLELEDVRRYSTEISPSHDSGHDDSDGEFDFPNVSLFSVAMTMMKKAKDGKRIPELPKKHRTRAATNWVKALGIVKYRGTCDPWDKFSLSTLPVEKAVRHRYHGLGKQWSQEEVFVKIDSKPFDEGAMRECYRMKKMDRKCSDADWIKDSNNYVAKCYKKGNECDRQTYFDDVCLQMDAKLWGEEYNRHNPPKKIDIFMMTVYEFTERVGSPLFHVEHFIDGDYIKYNSNSGFVDNRICRQTPQAFSHFTFECSGHELIVVDIQGVGDLYTDPQIHTFDGKEYGSGNLGPNGMALFFHSHACNSICKRLGLSPFALSHSEKQAIDSDISTPISQTVLRGQEVGLSGSPFEDMSVHLQAFFRNRSISSTGDGSLGEDSPRLSVNDDDERGGSATTERGDSVQSSNSSMRLRMRRGTDAHDDASLINLLKFREHIRQKKRPACLSTEKTRTMQAYDDSMLGMVHLALARYHEFCRFTDDGTYDKDAAFFHLQAAADCGVVDGITNVAKIYCGLPHDILSELTKDECPGEDEEDAIRIGLDYMERAAAAGVRSAMVYIAHAYDTGLNLANPEKDRSIATALYWYEEIQEYDQIMTQDNEKAEWAESDPPYTILARQAEILLMDGVEGVTKDPVRAGELYNAAAETATTYMKGKMANKYYMLAEEAYALVEEEEG